MIAYDIVAELEALRQQYRANGYKTPAEVVVCRAVEGGMVRYYVDHNGIKLGWVAKVESGWGAWLYERIGVGSSLGRFSTRRSAVEEVVWLAGRYESAVKIANAHVRMAELLEGGES